jgi:CelD/BcsL family acetyltransferase involved in cellulose biosynthesis
LAFQASQFSLRIAFFEEIKMQIEVVTDEKGFAALKPSWQELVTRSTMATPFQTWEWNHCSHKHLPNGQLWILTAKQAGELVAIMPLVIARGRRIGIRRVQWIGQGISDYQEMISLPEKALEAAAHFIEYIGSQKRRWDICDFANVRATSPLMALEPAGQLNTKVVPHYKCPAVALEGSFQDYLDSFNSKQRYSILQIKKHLQKDFGAEFENVETDLESAMQELFKLHNAQWQKKGMTGKFSDKNIQAFHLDVSRQFQQRGILKLYQMIIGGKAQALHYGFQLHNTFYSYLSGFDMALSKYSPGQAMIIHSMSKAVDEGANCYDFLSGEEHYKYFWRAQNHQTMRLFLTHYGMRSLIARVTAR